MTTLAYKEGTIAYDSRQTEGPTIVDDDADKMRQEGNYVFFLCGFIGDYKRLIDAFLKGKSEPDVYIDASAFVVDTENNTLFVCASNKTEGFWIVEKDLKKHWVLGSGGDHALTAMDMGATAYEAVKMAAKRDTGTGGKIQIFKLGTTNE